MYYEETKIEMTSKELSKAKLILLEDKFLKIITSQVESGNIKMSVAFKMIEELHTK